MGYSTLFSGEFKTSRPLTEDEIAYLHAFNKTRRMERDEVIASEFDDPIREAVGLPIGDDAEYFVGGAGWFGQDRDKSVLAYNNPPKNQPGLWCKWVPNADGTAIVWDQNEKFHDYIEWIEYIIEHFMKSWGITLNGVVDWQGEELGDVGSIIIQNNVLVNALENQPIEGEYQVIITDERRLLNHS